MSWNQQSGNQQYQQGSNWGSGNQQGSNWGSGNQQGSNWGSGNNPSFLIGGNSGQQNYGSSSNLQKIPDPTALLNLGGGSGNQYGTQKQQQGGNKKASVQQYNYGDNNYGRDSWFKLVRKNEKVAFNPHPSKTYKIMSALGKNMCLDVNMQANKIGLWTYKDSDNQKFRFQIENNRIMIFPLSCPGKCLEVNGGIMGNGINIVPALPTGVVHQKFQFVPNHNEGAKPNEFYIRTFCNKTFDLAKQSTVDGAQIFQYHFHGGFNQLWKIEPVQK